MSGININPSGCLANVGSYFIGSVTTCDVSVCTSILFLYVSIDPSARLYLPSGTPPLPVAGVHSFISSTGGVILNLA